jgi:phage gpG-like protein
VEISKDLHKILRESEQELANAMYLYLSASMGEALKVSDAYREGKSDIAFPKVTQNNSNKIRIKSKSLLNSFFREDLINYSNGIYSGVLKSDLPYARIHETGGFIKSKTKFSMFGGLMKKYFETGDEAYKYMALAVLKRGGLFIPARPYFLPFINEFTKKGLPDWWDEVEKRLNNYINSVVFNV